MGDLGAGRYALASGTHIQEFDIQAVLGGGGFGIVYLAKDTALQRQVALKEYMPPAAAREGGTTQVYVPSVRDTENFSAGLRSFVNEARLLAMFEHPALVKVHRFWEQNGTAYMVMPFYEGPTLQRAVLDKRVPTDEASLRRLLDPIMDALALLHKENCLHRDISPDNIMLTSKGPVLLDFGAARLVIGEASQNLTGFVKEGYAPLEQYGTEQATAMRQGPWTDIYALAGVIRFVITGTKPTSAVIRVTETADPLVPLEVLIPPGGYKLPFVRAVDAAMAIKVEKRPQTIEEFRALLSALPAALDSKTLVRPLPPEIAEELTKPSVPDAPDHRPPHAAVPPLTPVAPEDAREAAEGVTLELVYAPSPEPPSPDPVIAPDLVTEIRPAPQPPAEASSRRPLLIAAVLLFVPLSLAVAAYRFLPLRPEPATRTQPLQSTLTQVTPPAPPSSQNPASQSSSSKPTASSSSSPVLEANAPPSPPLNPSLRPMIEAARLGKWDGVESQAAAIAQAAHLLPGGNRRSSREHNRLGREAVQAHNFAKALSEFEQAVHEDPSDIEAANNYGYALTLAGRRVEALVILTGVLLRDPTREVAWTSWVEARSDDSAETLAALKIALHFAASRERTLKKYRDLALTHPDPKVSGLMKTLLEQADQVPTVPEGQH